MELTEYRDLGATIAREAGDIMLKYFDTDLERTVKEDKSIVTIADEEINRMVIERIAHHYPTHTVMGEEESSTNETEHMWVCDPLDGTVPFSRGIPISVFSLAYLHNGEPQVGIVYNPFTRKLYTAIKGQGAFCNDTRISVSKEPLHRQAIMDIEWWSGAEINIGNAFYTIGKETETYVLSLGSAIHAGCLVASGAYVGELFAGTKGKHVDLAALKVIVEEAGGKVTDINGNEQRLDVPDINGAIISNGVVHKDLVRFCAEARNSLHQ